MTWIPLTDHTRVRITFRINWDDNDNRITTVETAEVFNPPDEPTARAGLHMTDCPVYWVHQENQ